MSPTSLSPKEEIRGLNVCQWTLLLVSFFLGIACVLAVDHLFFSETSTAGTVHAATEAP